MLRLRDVHLDERYCLCHGKGDKQRVVPLGGGRSRRLKRICEHERPKLAARQEPPSAFLLLSSRGGRLRRERIWELVKLYAKQAGCAAELSPHSLRHSFATHLLGRRSRPAASARDARPRQHRHDADLHARRPLAAEEGPDAFHPRA